MGLEVLPPRIDCSLDVGGRPVDLRRVAGFHERGDDAEVEVGKK